MRALTELQWGDTQRLEDRSTVENISRLSQKKHRPFPFQTAFQYSLSSRLMAQSLITQTRSDESGSGSAGVKDEVSTEASASLSLAFLAGGVTQKLKPGTPCQRWRCKRRGRSTQNHSKTPSCFLHQPHLRPPLGNKKTRTDGARLLQVGVQRDRHLTVPSPAVLISDSLPGRHYPEATSHKTTATTKRFQTSPTSCSMGLPKN